MALGSHNTPYHDAAIHLKGERVAVDAFETAKAADLPPAFNPDQAIFGNVNSDAHLDFTRAYAGQDTGVIKTGLAGQPGHAGDPKEEARKRRQKTFEDQAFQLLLDRYRYLQTEIRKLEDYQDALGQHLQKLKNGKEIEINADGSLKNQKAEEAIRAYEEEYGIKVDRQDPQQIERVITAHAYKQAIHRREAQEIVEKAPEVKAEAEKLDRMDAQEAVALAQEAKANGQSDMQSDEIAANMNNDENKRAILKAQGLSDSNVNIALGHSLPDNAILGTENPFAKGDITNTFDLAANSQQADTLKTEPELYVKTSPNLGSNTV